MASMARIEMMSFLQGVDLFSFCDAEQILRLTAIASERTFRAGETIYRRDEPSEVLYCVVLGRIELGDESGTTRGVGAGGVFGIHDILKGVLRSADAVAREDARLLAIEAEDFFDLLSNNIDIVKALFRKLTRTVPETTGSFS
jgi:CRP-like cAMP-binding protein